MSDVTANLNLPADPEAPSTPAFSIPATPISAAYEVSDIPTITLPLTKATKSHIAAAISAVIGAAQVALTFLPVGDLTQYIAAGVGVVSVGATWLGVYVAPNLPKITKK